MNQRWKALQDDTPAPPKGSYNIFLSNNDKTGYSINVPMALTCQPTKACQAYCYGLEGRIRLENSLIRQTQNHAAFARLEHEAQEVLNSEARILGETVLRQQSFLRFFGVGDLQPGSVRFINALATVVPELTLWVSSRRFDLAPGLCHKPNVHLMLSVDSTTPPVKLEAARFVLRSNPQSFLAFVQRHPDEHVPDGATVIFAEHHVGSGRARWTSEIFDLRTCPATVVDGTSHENACEDCRFCFSTERRQTMTDGPGRTLVPTSTLIRKRR